MCLVLLLVPLLVRPSAMHHTELHIKDGEAAAAAGHDGEQLHHGDAATLGDQQAPLMPTARGSYHDETAPTGAAC